MNREDINSAISSLRGMIANGQETIKLFALSALLELDTAQLKAQANLPHVSTVTQPTDGTKIKTTPLVVYKQDGKKPQFQIASVITWLEEKLNTPRAGRGPNPEGKKYSLRLTDAQYSEVSTYLMSNFGKTLTDVALELKLKQESKKNKNAEAVPA